MRLWVYVVRRVVLAVPVLIGILTVLFVILSALPESTVVCSFWPPSGKVSPCTSEIPCPQNPSQLCPNPVYQAGVNGLGLNQPVFVQWFNFVGNALTFHWGYVAPGSGLGVGLAGAGLPALAGDSVSGLIGTFLPYTLELLLLTFALTLLVVVPIQRRARAWPGGWADHVARALTVPGYAISIVIIGPLVAFGVMDALGGAAAPSPICGSSSTVFLDFFRSWPEPTCKALYGTSNLGLFGFPTWLGLAGYQSTPTGFPTLDAAIHGDGWLALDTVLRMVLPALTLTWVAVAVVFRYVRFTPFEKEPFEFLAGARARGLPESDVARRLAGRSALSEVTSGLGPALAMVLGMLPLVEGYFGLWGVGSLFTYSVLGGSPEWDFGVMIGTILTCTLLVFLGSLALDLVRAYFDPRFRLEGSNGDRLRVSSGSVHRPRSLDALAPT